MGGSQPAGWSLGKAEAELGRPKAFGSGYFASGEDELGLPAYRYSCYQTVGRNARTPVETFWRSETRMTTKLTTKRGVPFTENGLVPPGHFNQGGAEGSSGLEIRYDDAQSRHRPARNVVPFGVFTKARRFGLAAN